LPPPNRSPAESLELPKSQEKKMEEGVGLPDHLGQTNSAEIYILVAKYISKLNKTQNTNRMPYI